MSLCQEFANDGVVGIDLAGDEPVWQAPTMEGHVIAYEVLVCYTSVSILSSLLIMVIDWSTIWSKAQV